MVCVEGGDVRLRPEQVAAVVASAGPPGDTTVAEWVAKSRQESTHRPKCVNEIGAVGLWQIRDIHWNDTPERARSAGSKENFRAQLKGEAFNFNQAKILYNDGGWRHWAASGGRPTPNAEDTAAAANPNADGLYVGGDIGEAVEGLGPLNPIDDVAGALGALFDVVSDAARWIGDRSNWARIAFVVLGGVVTATALVTIAKPAVEDTARTIRP